MSANQLTFLEELEPRIAPATFVMGADGTTITGAGASDNLDAHTSDAVLVGYAAPAEGYAFLLKKGDKLVFDADGNGLDKNDATLVSVEGGSALFFFGDHDSNGSTPFAITGASVGDKFSGSVNTTIYGGVVTALSSTGHLTMTGGDVMIQSASITKLTITGFVDASIAAGGSISALTVSGYSNLGGEEGYSVEGIYAGSATDTDVNQDRVYLGKQVGYDAVFSTVGGAGGSISNVELAGATKKILAGDGQLSGLVAINSKTKALAGGSITNVTVQSSADLADDVFFGLEVRAGNGSQAGTITDPITGDPIAGNAGGAGGSVSKLTVKYGSLGQLTVQAGHGNHGGYNSAGGAGGAISTITASVVGATVIAGEGGNAGSAGKTYDILDEGSQYIITGSAAAGVGGSVTGVTLTATAPVGADEVEVFLDSSQSMDVDSVVRIFAGNGGEGGAAGGSVTKTALLGTYFDDVIIKAGNGSNAYAGTGKAGGASGSIAGVSLKNLEIGGLSVGLAGPAFTLGGNGAEKFTLKSVVVEGDTFYTKTVTGGGAGGAGGSISGIQSDALAPGKVSSDFIAYGGMGGTGAYLANGGAGGAISAVNLSVQGDVALVAGYGGGGGAVETEYALSDSESVVLNSTGASGAGGSVSKVNLKAWGLGASSITIVAGSGSSWFGSSTTGGAGGNVSEVTITGNQAGSVLVGAGLGGSVMENSGRAGAAGGNVSKVSITLDTLGALLVNGGLSPGVVFGSGSDGAQKLTISKIKNSEFYKATYVGTAGGAGGSVSDITLRATSVAPNAAVQIFAGLGGNGSANEESSVAGNGGAGGKVEKVYLNAAYDKKTKTWNPVNLDGLDGTQIQILAGQGGNGKLAAAGGLVNEVRAFAKDATIEIFSGWGGNAYDVPLSKNGAGGNISNITAISIATNPEASAVRIDAGSAGQEGTEGLGNSGGSISNLYHVAGYETKVLAGDGSDGLTGGNGGSITGANLFSHLTPVGDLVVVAGEGGEGSNGAGGIGGSVSKVVADSAEYAYAVADSIPGGIGNGYYQGSEGDLTVEGAVSGVNLYGGYAQVGEIPSFYFWSGGQEGEIPAGSDYTLSEDALWVQLNTTKNPLNAIGNVTLSGRAYGDVYLNGYFGDVVIDGEFVDRVFIGMYNDEPSLLASLTITAKNNGVFFVTYDEDYNEIITEITDQAQLTGIVTGAFSNTGDPLGTVPDQQPPVIWTGSFAGNVTFEEAVFGDAKVTGRIDGDLSFLSEVNGRVLLKVSDYERVSIGGDLIVAGGNEGVFVQYTNYENQEVHVIALADWADWAVANDRALSHLVTIEGTTEISSDPSSAWKLAGFGLSVEAGKGGNGTTSGGAGGSITGSTFATGGGPFVGQSFGETPEWTIRAGDGGDGEAKAGAGGSVLTTTFKVNSEARVSITAGDGGEANPSVAKSIGGAAGNVTTLTLIADNSRIRLNAGDAGEGSKAVVGGKVSAIAFSGFYSSFFMNGGQGASGGAGGNVESISEVNPAFFDSTQPGGAAKYTLLPSSNSLTLIAGDGSQGATASGAGGSVKTVSVVAPSIGESFTATAGKGAAGDAPGVGGSLEGINLLDNASVLNWSYVKGKLVTKKVTAVFDPALISGLGSATLIGGAGGNNTGSGAGAKGGDVKNVKWNLDTLSRFLAEGAGGNGTPAGLNGNVVNVNAPYDPPDILW